MTSFSIGRLHGELELPLVGLLLGLGDLVVADLADRHDSLLEGEARQLGQHFARQALVVGLLAVEAHGAVVRHAELRGAEALPTHEARPVVDEGAHAGARLPEPEGRFDDGAHPRLRHRLEVVGGAAGHVDVGIEESHVGASALQEPCNGA
jgi:hypothetical protein